MAVKDLFSEPPLSASEAASQFAAPVNVAALDGNDAVEKNLCKAWTELIEIVATTPHDQQEPLIDFIKQLRTEPNPENRDGKSCKVWGNLVEWKNLPLLGPALREAWNNVPMDSERGEKAIKWVNLNGFVARLTSLSSASNPLDFSIYGVWGIRSALEDRNPEAKMPPQHAVEAASVWMIYAADVLWDRSVTEHVYDGKSAREGTTLRGKEWRGCSKERWGVWKVRLAEIWERYEEGEVKEMVEKTCKEMAKVEAK